MCVRKKKKSGKLMDNSLKMQNIYIFCLITGMLDILLKNTKIK